MNPMTRTVAATITLTVANPKTGKPDARLANVGNVVGVRMKKPSGVVEQITGFTVPRAGRIFMTVDIDEVGTHEVVARLDLGGQLMSTTPYRFRADPDTYGE